ncbi:Coenzyme F420 hydrogenase/dehydrogenase, beta subunit C-terminal domain [Campylobacter geochelonis]|uniref:4Fe-4S ferredoxin iron-sulfur binding domain-containing protein n=1 Tax=Campylobacter geochelonis TaxID=1780362 RepID=A0A128EG70_9BACT|nr:Coenzyme F420 hydrogenase/dehydrogenase, beta subunit C-terminal domain [Campylobacter geochelonis]QKF71858.1 coenzyme F420 hydrogenase/dehydrogenase, beta subunit family protein [Campylobacter geochelonis]CZE47392.1 4Fe-4S ferredoxin iron-sulfur binding domain-containing protein [Campylobacter geochelonis]
MNVIKEVVKQNRCIGCGVCAPLCPANVLDMKLSSFANFTPILSEGCIKGCDICLKVCPFYDKELEENELTKKLYQNTANIKFDEDLGYFLNGYEFYNKDEKERLKSASGGAGSYVLKKLLEQNLVDKIICVKSCRGSNSKGFNESDFLFEFGVFDSLDDNSRSSAYYPLNLQEVLDYVLKNDFKYAITALPCFAKALRLAMSKSARIKNRIKFIIGLVCGQNKSANFTQKLASIAFDKKDIKLKSVNFRYKFADKNAMQFGFKFSKNDDEIAFDDRNKSAFKWWSSRAFTPFACNNCIDTFAKCADVVLMDAWLEDKIADYRGHSLVLVRSSIIDEIFKTSDEFCKSIDKSLILRSQAGVMANKKLVYYGSKNIIKKRILALKLEIQKYSNEHFDCDEFVEKRVKKIEKFAKMDAKFETAKYLFKKYF